MVRNKLIIALVVSVITYFIDHRVYLIIINTLIPLILAKDLISFREQVRLFINDGDPVRSAKVSLNGVTIDDKELVGLKVLSTTYAFDSAFEEALARARALVRLFSKYKVIASISPSGGYVIAVNKGAYKELIAELERLGINVVRINGFELANALRMRVRRRSLNRLPLLLLLIPTLIAVSAYVLLTYPILYLVYSIGDFSKRRFVINMGFNNEVVRDLRALVAMDNTMIRAEVISLRSRINDVGSSIFLVISSNDELRNWIKSSASKAYGKFLMLRHIKYFLNYKDLEITLRRIQQGEDIYSLYLASTTRFDSSLKWKWTPSIPISRILSTGHGHAWSMELNLVVFTPYSFQLISERYGLAVIGRDINKRRFIGHLMGQAPTY